MPAAPFDALQPTLSTEVPSVHWPVLQSESVLPVKRGRSAQDLPKTPFRLPRKRYPYTLPPQIPLRTGRIHKRIKMRLTWGCAVIIGRCFGLGLRGLASSLARWTLIMHRPMRGSTACPSWTSMVHARATSRGLELQVGMFVSRRAQLVIMAWRMKPAPRVNRATELMWTPSVSDRSTGFSSSRASSGLRLRKIRDVDPYERIMPIK